MQKNEKTESLNQDVLEAYPTRMHVEALPDRRFFRMTRTLTIINALSVCLVIALSCFFYYAMDNQDVDIRYPSGQNALYSMDRANKTLTRVDLTTATYSPIQLMAEEALKNYIQLRHSVVWDKDEMSYRLSPVPPPDRSTSLLKLLSSDRMFGSIVQQQNEVIEMLRKEGLVRDVHIYELKHVYGNLWTATVDLFDIPIDRDTLEPFCMCQDNSKQCLDCKVTYAKEKGPNNRSRHQRLKIWARIGRANRPTHENPFGFSMNSYIVQYIPLHEKLGYWDFPAKWQTND